MTTKKEKNTETRKKKDAKWIDKLKTSVFRPLTIHFQFISQFEHYWFAILD
jgi:hypothetical protein